MLMRDACKGMIDPISTSKRDSRNAFVDIMVIRIIFNQYVDLYFYKFGDNSKGHSKIDMKMDFWENIE